MKLDRRRQEREDEEMKEVKEIRVRKDYTRDFKSRGNKSFDSNSGGYLNVRTLPDQDTQERPKKEKFSYRLYKVRGYSPLEQHCC